MNNMKQMFLITLMLSLSIAVSNAQKIDNLSSFRDTGSDKYLRFNYDNDLFMGMDENYTQGFSLEYVAPFWSKNPLNYLFLKPKNDEQRFGITVEHNSFTPKKYFLPEIQLGDRPFAATLVLESFMISIDPLKARRFTSAFAIGVIGTAAFGEEIQVGIHKVTNSATPRGWDNQIKNDLVLNYEIGYEKQLLRWRNLLSIQTNMNARVGTLNIKASVGGSFQIGLLNSSFTSVTKRKDFNLYFYAQPMLNIIGYDATLQGGLFNRNSLYTISSNGIERFTGQFNYGLVLKLKSLYFELSGSVISKEFETESSARWGGVRVGILL